jgi:adenylate cyclase
MREVRLFQWASNPEESLLRAEKAVQRALQIDPNNARAYHVLTHIWRARKNPEAALRAAERAVELNPNFANALGVVALMKIYLGRAEEAIGPLNEALRLSPHDPCVGNWLYFLGTGYLLLGREDDAIECLEKATVQSPKFRFVASLAGERLCAP